MLEEPKGGVYVKGNTGSIASKVNLLLWKGGSSNPIAEIVESMGFRPEHDYSVDIAAGMQPGEVITDYKRLEGPNILVIRHQNAPYFNRMVIEECALLLEEQMGLLRPDDFVALFHQGGKPKVTEPQFYELFDSFQNAGYDVLAFTGHDNFAAGLMEHRLKATKSVAELAGDYNITFPSPLLQH